MILQQDKVVKLCLGSFSSGNLIHFWPERRKSHWTNMRFEQSEKKILRSSQPNRAERPRISISPMHVSCHLSCYGRNLQL